MLSILIPCYNYDVSVLTKELHKQLCEITHDFEILIFDDGSNSHHNHSNNQLNTLNKVTFSSHETNIGLSLNRNSLIEAAKFNYLLLIDADMLVVSTKYISKYINQIYKDKEVAYGGMIYSKEPPDSKFKLRWSFGKVNEAKNTIQRLKSPYKNLFSSNLLIKRSLAKSILYETSLKTYGYEDTVFANILKQKQIKIHHIENPLLHNDKTTNEEFITKTEIALHNLKDFLDHQKLDRNFTYLGRMWSTIHKLKLYPFTNFIYVYFGKLIKRRLILKSPNLYLFKFYKLLYFSHINKSNQ